MFSLYNSSKFKTFTALIEKSLGKLKLGEKEKEDILLAITPLLAKIDELEKESEKNIELEKERLRTQILSSVSHDLKTPLAAIIGSLNILTSMDSKISDEQKKDLMETSVSEANRLNNFITNILNMARIESGATKAKMEWYGARDMLKHIEKRFKDKYPERILKVQDITGDINFNTDPILFEQIMMILLDNATKYSPLETEIELHIEKATSLNFLIRDHGKGISEDMLEKIFDKYTRLQIGDRQIAGTGLGLAIAKSLTELQNMDITAFNHEKGGTVFKLSCPEWKISSSIKVANQAN